MTLVDDAKKILYDSIKLYKKSILVYRYSKRAHSHHASTHEHHPVHCYNLIKIHDEYEKLLKDLSKRIKKIKHVVRK